MPRGAPSSERVQVPVTPDQRRRIEAAAERRHLTLAAFARQSILDAVEECCDLFDAEAAATTTPERPPDLLAVLDRGRRP